MGSVNTLKDSISRKATSAHRPISNATQQDCSVGGHILNIKRCTKCRVEKSISGFTKHRTTKDGYNCWCKNCCRLYKISERGRAASRRYEDSDKGKAKTKIRDTRRKLLYPERIAANLAVNNAVCAGTLPPVGTRSCSCGLVASDYHHESYAVEDHLYVIPVCRTCHRKIHTNNSSCHTCDQSRQGVNGPAATYSSRQCRASSGKDRDMKPLPALSWVCIAMLALLHLITIIKVAQINRDQIVIGEALISLQKIASQQLDREEARIRKGT